MSPRYPHPQGQRTRPNRGLRLCHLMTIIVNAKFQAHWGTDGDAHSQALFSQSCPTLCNPKTSGFPVLHYLSEFAQIHVHWCHWCPLMSMMPSYHLILSSPFLFMPSIFPSIRVFSSESALHIRWPKYWSFSFSISLSKESVQFNLVTQSNSLQPHGLQHTRLPCPSPTPRTCSNSCPCVMTSNQLILYHPLLLPSVLPSIRVFSNELALHIR